VIAWRSGQRSQTQRQRKDLFKLITATYSPLEVTPSFLLQKDYKIHIPVIEELLKEKYDSLSGIKCLEFRKEINQRLLGELNEFIRDHYDAVRSSVKKREIKNDVSYTLITKILMGTLGCVPAYDRFFISGIKSRNVATGTYSIKSVLQLADFYENNAGK